MELKVDLIATRQGDHECTWAVGLKSVRREKKGQQYEEVHEQTRVSVELIFD